VFPPARQMAYQPHSTTDLSRSIHGIISQDVCVFMRICAAYRLTRRRTVGGVGTVETVAKGASSSGLAPPVAAASCARGVSPRNGNVLGTTVRR
jgi:hypothetical protein